MDPFVPSFVSFVYITCPVCTNKRLDSVLSLEVFSSSSKGVFVVLKVTALNAWSVPWKGLRLN